jgi:hypothetical protein
VIKVSDNHKQNERRIVIYEPPENSLGQTGALLDILWLGWVLAQMLDMMIFYAFSDSNTI